MNRLSTILILAAISLPAFSFADSMPSVPFQGGQMLIVSNKQIVLQEETIRIDLYMHHYEVTVDYVFENKGKALDLYMSFPNLRGRKVDPISNFHAFDGGEELPVTRTQGITADLGDDEEWFMETYPVAFKNREKKKIRNSYTQSYIRQYETNRLTIPSRRAVYILRTGGFWKDKIRSAKVAIIAHLTQSELETHPTAVKYEPFFRTNLKLENRFKISPAIMKIRGKEIHHEFREFKPDFDIVIDLPLSSQGISANWTLLEGGKSYDAGLMQDGDLSTAWAARYKDFSVYPDSLGTTTNPIIQNGFVHKFDSGGIGHVQYLFQKLGIRNGYQKSMDLYLKNRRARNVSLSYEYYDLSKILRYTNNFDFQEYHPYPDGVAFGRTNTTSNFLLTDTTNEQFFYFSKPTLLISAELTILDYYPGLKYDDICISELYFYPATNGTW